MIRADNHLHRTHNQVVLAGPQSRAVLAYHLHPTFNQLPRGNAGQRSIRETAMWCRSERSPEQVQQAMRQTPAALTLHRAQLGAKAAALAALPPPPAIPQLGHYAGQWVFRFL